MCKRLLRLLIILVFLAVATACEPAPPTDLPPTAPPFPTMTPGQMIRAALPPPNVIPLDGGAINPATQAALTSRATPTPNLHACPGVSDSAVLIDTVPVTARAMELAIETFLSSGGTAIALQRDLDTVWNTLGGTGFVRNDIDLTGEGTADFVVSLTTPDEGGAIVILSCTNGRVTSLYREALGGQSPSILRVEDMNADGRTDVLFSSQDCLSGRSCVVRTQLAGSVDGQRIVNLMAEVLETTDPIRIDDMDGDRINEIIVQFGSEGSPETGPQRTGFTVYDWDGFVYRAALTQLEAPRYLVQVMFDADQAFAAGQYEQAAAMYNAAIANPALESWQPDDRTVLPPYMLYRMLLAYSTLDDARRSDVQQAILVQYPDPATQPVYATMALTFWNAYQITNNLNSACLEVLSIIASRPEALSQLNRYGSASPTYTAQDLCPF
ncbi:MAG: hypothetical protein U0670_03935 [Anaerolineae bacterium]